MAWLDASAYSDGSAQPGGDRIDWLRCVPFIAMHAACLLVFVVGWSPTALLVAAGLYLVRMFAITGFYHRYFSHRSFKASRPMQFAMAVLGNSAVQRGPLWWAAHHRHHHRHSDTVDDLHTPHHHGFLWSHMLWLMTGESFATRTREVPDLAKFPELRFLDRFDWVVPVCLAAGLLATGHALAHFAPGLGVTGPQLLVWGFFVSTIVLFHGTCLINSMAHLVGTRPYDTRDHSRNSLLLSLVTLGEGWHNNHHFCPSAARQGFLWWEIDITYYGLRVMQALGLISGLREVPAAVLAQRSAR